MALRDKLVEEQRRLQLSDAEFAKRLGISKTLWTRVRLGDREIRHELLAGVAREFPELHTDIITFLQTGSTAVAAVA